MKLAITGATGFVGNKLKQMYPDAVLLPSLRGKTPAEIEKLMKNCPAEVLVHTAAISDIPTCDKYPEESYLANVTLPLLLARFFPGKLLFFSSDQVYSGQKAPGPYTEDMTAPGNLYAREKAEMESRVLELRPDGVMLRAEWMYDAVSYKGNYFINVSRADGALRFSGRQYRGVTYVKEVGEAIPALTGLPGGVYNFGSETTRSIRDITVDFLSFLGKETPVEDCPPGHNLWMNCAKARAGGVVFSEVLQGLKRCARDYNMEIER